MGRIAGWIAISKIHSGIRCEDSSYLWLAKSTPLVARTAPGYPSFMACKPGCCGKDHGPIRDDEGPSPEDVARFGDVTRECPECKKQIHDDAAVCYHCGFAVEGGPRAAGASPKWAMVVAGIVLVGFAALILLRT